MTSLGWILVSAAVILCLLWVAQWWTNPDGQRQRRNGVVPGQGDSLVHGGASGGKDNHSATVRVPKDPQAYAKGMMPGRCK